MPNSKQQIANAAFRKKLKRIDVQIPLDAWPIVEEYANTRGVAPGVLLKQCLARCMQLDGYMQIALHVSQANTSKPATHYNANDNDVVPNA